MLFIGRVEWRRKISRTSGRPPAYGKKVGIYGPETV